MAAGGEDVAAQVADLEARLASQERRQAGELQQLQAEVANLRSLTQQLELQPKSLDGPAAACSNHFVRRAEWAIADFSAEERKAPRGKSIWSPEFSAAGLEGLRLEFFPHGRETTTFEGFCSLFLWCPSGTHVKYQLWVGGFLRAPDEDGYVGHIGHGHSNFCPLEPEVDRAKDSVTVGVDFLQATRSEDAQDAAPGGVRLVTVPLERMIAREVEIVQNRGINRVVWRIHKISERMLQYPRGSSVCSRLFSAAGIRDILLEFYPNGSENTTKDGFCALYVRCPAGVSIVVTLFVGSARKGPIKTVFESLQGKGLPDFCPAEEHINKQDDVLEVGIELENQSSRILSIES